MKSKTKSKLIVAITLSVLSLSVGGRAANNNKEAGPMVQVYAHRGGRLYMPENSRPAYSYALKLGVDWVDMDVALTKDGEVVISHDLVLNPDITRDENGNFLAGSKEALAKLSKEEQAQYVQKYAIKNLTVGEIQKYDVGFMNHDSAYSKFFPDQVRVDGTRIEPLRDIIHFVDHIAHGKVGFQVEMKTDPGHPEYSSDPEIFAQKLYSILKEEGVINRVEVQAFDFRCLAALRKLDHSVKTAFLTSRDNEPGGADDFYNNDPKAAGLWTGGVLVKDFGGSIPKMVKALGGFAWEPEDFELSENSLKESHALGLKVVVWTWPEMAKTVFDPQMVDKLINWGVDGIITDDPGRLTSMLLARGAHAPPRYEAGHEYLSIFKKRPAN